MMVPVYGALHFIPMLLFKRQIVMKTPVKMLLKAAWGTSRSSAFLGVFVAFFKGNIYHYAFVSLLILCYRDVLWEKSIVCVVAGDRFGMHAIQRN